MHACIGCQCAHQQVQSLCNSGKYVRWQPNSALRRGSGDGERAMTRGMVTRGRSSNKLTTPWIRARAENAIDCHRKCPTHGWYSEHCMTWTNYSVGTVSTIKDIHYHAITCIDYLAKSCQFVITTISHYIHSGRQLEHSNMFCSSLVLFCWKC